MNSPVAEKQIPLLARVLAFGLALLLVLGVPLSLLAFDGWRVVFNPPLLKRVLADEAVNHDLLPVALEWFSHRRAQERVTQGEALTGLREPDIVLLMSFLDREDWRQIKAEVLPPDIVGAWVTTTVDGAYAWLDSADRVPQITWEIQPFKDRVNSEHGVNAIVIAYDNLPPCTQTEIDDFQARLAAAPSGAEVLYNLCEFPAPWHEDQFNDYVSALHKVTDNIPAQFALTRELAQIPDNPQGVGPEWLKQQLRLMRLVGQWAWLAPLALIGLVALLAVRSMRQLGRWVGVPVLIGGLLALLPTLVYRSLITGLLSVGALSEVPELVIQEATRAILRLAAAVFQPLLIQAVIFMLLGVGLVIWYRFRRPAAQA